MNKKKATVGSSLLKAIGEYALKIEKIRKHDPDNRAELACLYSGISGINECVVALKTDGFIAEQEDRELDVQMHRLYELCRAGS